MEPSGTLSIVGTYVGLFGALQAWLLAAATWWGVRRGASERAQARLLALLFVILGLVVATISVDHAGWLDRSVPLDWIEYGLSLLAPPVFLAYARRVVGRGLPRLWWPLQLLPVSAWLAWTLSTSRIWDDPSWPPIGLIVVYQVAYTVSGAALAFPGPPRATPGLSMLRAWIAGFSLVHLAQLARLTFRRVDAFDDVVPITAAVVLYGLVLFALRSARLLQPAQPRAPAYSSSGLSAEDADDAAGRIQRLLAVDQAYLDADLDLESLASRVGLSRSHASQVINQTLGSTFAELVNQHRVEAAREMLADPSLDHVTVDAVGQRAGFASRSSFYEAFRRHTGSTPGRFRAQRD